ncbi:hypothetical protein B9Z48_12200 [Limnohabitans sp. WS1]|nr:hypothetical protein B9Z48_12200 [Limnohabitans sp. WS1]
MGQICIDLSKLFRWMDVVGFLLAGLGALLILASVAFTGVVKNGDAFDDDDEVDQYIFEMKAKKIWLREVVWWLIKKGNTWFLFISSVGFLLQIPEKFWK